MISTGTDALGWLADVLGLPLLDAPVPPAKGLLALNDAARRLSEQAKSTSLEATLAAIARVAEDDPGLRRLVAAAKRGDRACELLGPDRAIRALAFPEGLRLRILVAPATIAHSTEIQRRAAVADLAAGAAHELANALGAISGWAEIARETPARAPEAVNLIA